MTSVYDIYNEVEPFLDKPFIETRTGKKYYLVGVLVGKDDYYYAMYSKEHGLLSLSCVGNLDGWGFQLVEENE